MKNLNGVSRRNFIRQTSLGFGAGIVGISIPPCKTNMSGENTKLPRDICVASIDLKGLWPDTTRESRINKILARMAKLAGLHPDIICLPELFDTMWVDEQLPLKKVAEDENVPGTVTGVIAEFAKKHNCYIVCPVYTTKNGHYYNSSILLDRKGSIAGVYHKIHPVKSEMVSNNENKVIVITSWAIDQPVLETDLGKVGMQICYDANWSDGWDNLKKEEAEIILFS